MRNLYKNDGGTWDITNYGALMIAADLRKFERLSKRVVRVIRYPDKSRLGGIGEREFSSGYVISFEEIVAYIMTVIPQEEIMERGIRRQRFSFPESAIRELLANTLVHQALDQYGTNPMIEIFADRIEFSNAGAPLVAIERIIDTVPLSRNKTWRGSCTAVVFVRSAAVAMTRLLLPRAQMRYWHQKLKTRIISLQR